MVSNGIPIPENEKHAKLMTAFADELHELATLSMGECMTLSAYLVERTVKEGWKPPVKELTPEEEVDLMDRIISDLPVAYTQPANPEGNYEYKKPALNDVLVDRTPFIVEEYMEDKGEEIKVYDVAVLHPQVVNIWKLIPEFENYEANPLGIVRSRWTKRTLEVAKIGDQESVEMHDKDGFPHEVNIRYVIEKTFTD